jgi:hypothetical protein
MLLFAYWFCLTQWGLRPGMMNTCVLRKTSERIESQPFSVPANGAEHGGQDKHGRLTLDAEKASHIHSFGHRSVL